MHRECEAERGGAGAKHQDIMQSAWTDTNGF